MESSWLGYRVSLGMSFLGARFLTVAITEESVVNLKRWQLADREFDPGGTPQ